MRSPLWVNEFAEGFWATVGTPEPFPRTLRESIPWAVPLTVVEVPNLCAAGALEWLSRRGVASAPVSRLDRPLRGFLFAHQGVGFAFLDGNDDPRERVFSLAHELAHFLRDYLQPRRDVERRLGREVLEVFDGLRPPRAEERLHAILCRVALGPHTHSLARDPDPGVERAEQEADRLACELLAPLEAVLSGGSADRDSLVMRLCREFGLPPRPARRYADWLLPQNGEVDALKTRLGFSVAELLSRGNNLGRQDG